MRPALSTALALCVLAPCALALCVLTSCSSKSDDEDPGKSTDPGAAVHTQNDAGAAVHDPSVPRSVDLPPAPPVPEPAQGLPADPRASRDDPPRAARIALGRLLFFDSRLSTGERMSCASCHDPDKGWSDALERARTAAGKLDLRHTATLVNLVYAESFGWDGRYDDLATMIAHHWKGQMLVDGAAERAVGRIRENPVYRAHFTRAFGIPSRVDADRASAALASFVRTIYSGGSPWDRYEAGEPGAVSSDAIAGFQLFHGKAQCSLCHPPPLYTDHAYHDVGVGALGPDDRLLDLGRGLATGAAEDAGRFKTPSLRHLGRTAPYFHDGSAPDLAATIGHGLESAAALAGQGTTPPAPLSSQDRDRLLAFLRALTPVATTEAYDRPRLPPARPAARQSE